MNKKIKIPLIVIVVFTALYISLWVNEDFQLQEEIRTSIDMDIEFFEATQGGFAISTSDVNVLGIHVIDENEEILLKIEQGGVGFISMDDPLPILQKLFPDANKTSLIVLADGVEIPFIHKGGTLQFDVNNATEIQIIGF